jgi:hypothetical protein
MLCCRVAQEYSFFFCSLRSIYPAFVQEELLNASCRHLLDINSFSSRCQRMPQCPPSKPWLALYQFVFSQFIFDFFLRPGERDIISFAFFAIQQLFFFSLPLPFTF